MRCFFRLLLLASVPVRAPTPDYPDRAGASIEILPSSCPSETRPKPIGTFEPGYLRPTTESALPALLSRAPSEGRSHRIIPDRAHGSASDASDPPERMLLGEQQAGDADIRDCPKAADQDERH
jgi:hypothetical protein